MTSNQNTKFCVARRQMFNPKIWLWRTQKLGHMIQYNMGDWSAEGCFNVHYWLGSPSVNMFTVQFLLRRLSDLYALSLPGPPMCLPLDNVSSIFVEVCCSCRFRSLRPAYESAEKGHLVPGSSSVTSLWDADVGRRDMWARSRRSSPV